MTATVLRYVNPLIVILTGGRLPLPSASTISAGTRMPVAVLSPCRIVVRKRISSPPSCADMVRGSRGRPTAPASGVRRDVGQVQDARAQRARLGELEGDPLAAIVEQALALTDDDRVDQQPQLIEHAVPQQRAYERRAPGDRDVLARLVLDPA